MRFEMMNRYEILKSAIEIVCGERQNQYGDVEDNFKIIADLWQTYVKAKCISEDADISFCPEDVAVMMILLKVARIASGHGKDDNWIDIAGYAACGGEVE